MIYYYFYHFKDSAGLCNCVLHFLLKLDRKKLLFVDTCIQSFSVFLYNFTFDKIYIPKKHDFILQFYQEEPDCYIKWAHVFLMSTNQIQEDTYFVFLFWLWNVILPYWNIYFLKTKEG